MTQRVTVACPNCSSTGTYVVGFVTGSGSTPASCRSCHKTFRIYMRRGELYEVKKN